MQFDRVNNEEDLVLPALFVWNCKLGALLHCTAVFQHGSPWNVLVIGLSSFMHIFGLFIRAFLQPATPYPAQWHC